MKQKSKELREKPHNPEFQLEIYGYETFSLKKKDQWFLYLYPMKRTETMANLLSVNILTTQIVISKYYFPLK